MAEQVQIRRDTNSNLLLATPADGELAYDTTNDRLHLGDGTTAGGIATPNFKDIQKSGFIYDGSPGGTADAITLAFSPSLTAYAAGVVICFKAAATNTGAVTVNVDSLGVKNIQKMSSGSLAALAAGDISSGHLYYAIYDGTQFQILNELSAVSTVSVSQGDINTSTGTFSVNVNGGGNAGQSFIVGSVTLPGGQYGFDVETKDSSSRLSAINSWVKSNSGTSYASKASVLVVNTGAPSGSALFYGQQRYITSSPPFNMGDGDVNGFVFLRVKKGTGQVVGHYAADVPPWAYNGPTNIRADKIDGLTGKKYRLVQNRSLLELMDGASPEYVYEEITHSLKNADMDLIPHPFGEIGADEQVVLLDPMDNRMLKLIEHMNFGGSDEVTNAIASGKIYADNEALSRRGPKNVMQAALRFKYSG